MTSGTTLAERNRTTIEALYAAGAAGDIATVLSYVADDVVIDEPPYLPYGGRYMGKQIPWPLNLPGWLSFGDVRPVFLRRPRRQP